MDADILKMIIIFLFLTSVLSGCINVENNDQNNQDKIWYISFKELEDNLDKYLGNEISIEGYISKGYGDNVITPYVTNFCSSNLSNPKYCVLLNVPTNVTIFEGTYRITGIAGEHPNTYMITIDVTLAESLER